MPTIQLNVPEELDKKILLYKIDSGLKQKQEVILEILQKYFKQKEAEK